MSDAAPPEERVDTVTEELIEQTKRDPSLSPEERETLVRFGTDQSEAAVYTEEPALVRRLLAHSHTTVEEVRVIDEDDDDVRYLSLADAVANDGVDGRVVSLRGRLPVRCLVIKAVPRKATGHAAVVSREVLKE